MKLRQLIPPARLGLIRLSCASNRPSSWVRGIPVVRSWSSTATPASATERSPKKAPPPDSDSLPKRNGLVAIKTRMRLHLDALDLGKMEEELECYFKDYPNLHDEDVYSIALQCFIRGGKLERAQDLFARAIYSGYKPTVEALDMLIGGHLRFSDVDRAQSVMDSFELHGLSPRSSTYNLWIKYYLRDQQSGKARKMFHEMEQKGLSPTTATFQSFLIHFIDCADFEAAEKVQQYIKAKKYRVGVKFYNLVIEALLRKTAFREVETVLAEMKDAGIAYDERTYNSLIGAYARINAHDKVNELMTAMRAAGLKPSTKTFNKIMASFSQSIKPEQTKQILMQMNHLGLAFDKHTYASLLQTLIVQQKYREAVELLYDMERKGIAMPVECYGKLVKLCCDRRLTSLVLLLRFQMRRLGVPPNHFIYSNLINYYLSYRNYASVDAILLEMQRSRNLKANPFIFCSLLNHFVENLDFKRIDGLLQMMQKQQIEVTPTIYGVLMKTFYAYSRYDLGGHVTRFKGLVSKAEKAKLKAEDGETDNGEEGDGVKCDDDKDLPLTQLEFCTEVDRELVDIAKLKQDFEKMFRLPFKPTVHLFNEIMLEFFVRERFDEMFAMVEEMRKSGLVPNLFTYTILIKAHIFNGEIEEAKQLLSEMGKAGLHPTSLHCALIFHAHCRHLQTKEAESLMLDIENIYHIKPNHVFYASLIFAYTRRREYSNVFAAFERLEAAGYMPDTETCNYVLISLLEVGEFVEAQKFFQKMLLQGIRRNQHTYSYLAEGYMARNEVDRLLNLFSDCTAPGNTIDARPFNRILDFVYDSGDLGRVVRTLEKMVEYCVRFDRETIPYLTLAFKTLRGDQASWPLLRALITKAIIEVDQQDQEEVSRLCDDLKKLYSEAGFESELARFETFLAKVPHIRKLLMQISPNIEAMVTDTNNLPVEEVFEVDFGELQQIRERHMEARSLLSADEQWAII